MYSSTQIYFHWFVLVVVHKSCLCSRAKTQNIERIEPTAILIIYVIQFNPNASFVHLHTSAHVLHVCSCMLHSSTWIHKLTTETPASKRRKRSHNYHIHIKHIRIQYGVEVEQIWERIQSADRRHWTCIRYLPFSPSIGNVFQSDAVQEWTMCLHSFRRFCFSLKTRFKISISVNIVNSIVHLNSFILVVSSMKLQ